MKYILMILLLNLAHLRAADLDSPRVADIESLRRQPSIEDSPTSYRLIITPPSHEAAGNEDTLNSPTTQREEVELAQPQPQAKKKKFGQLRNKTDQPPIAAGDTPPTRVAFTDLLPPEQSRCGSRKNRIMYCSVGSITAIIIGLLAGLRDTPYPTPSLSYDVTVNTCRNKSIEFAEQGICLSSPQDCSDIEKELSELCGNSSILCVELQKTCWQPRNILTPKLKELLERLNITPT